MSRPATWPHGPHAWRLAARIGRREVDLLLRVRSAKGLPRSVRSRLFSLGLPEDDVIRTLGEIRSLAQWPEAWTATAQRYLGEARRQGTGDQEAEMAYARRCAALCYHVAHFQSWSDPRTARTLRANASSLFSQSVPHLAPPMRRLLLPWRNTTLPAYLVLPVAFAKPWPLAVFLNGATTAKEEVVLWSQAFLDRGIAVLAVDSPGTGEAGELGPLRADHDDVTDGVFTLAADDAALDPRRVALVGVSLGGTMAVRSAAHDRRVAAVVAVTPPYDAGQWHDRANALAVGQLMALMSPDLPLAHLAAVFALPGVVRRLRAPLLVLGAGRDLVVPPAEAVSLAAAVGEDATLLWYPKLGHGLFEAIPTWTADAARWLTTVLRADAKSVASSTRVDAPSGASAVRSSDTPGRPD